MLLQDSADGTLLAINYNSNSLRQPFIKEEQFLDVHTDVHTHQ